MELKYEIKANVEKNVLHIKLKGFGKTEEIKLAIAKIISEASKLSKGFDIINDISTFTPVAQKDSELIKGVMIKMKEMGVNKVVRIVNNAIIANMQLKINSKEAGYDALVAKNEEEAFEVLNK